MLIKLSQDTLSRIKNELLEPNITYEEPDSFKNELENLIGDEFKFIDSGAFSLTYEKDGLIFKFTETKKDVLKTKLFHEIANKLPEKYQKYVMYVDDIGSFKLNEKTIYYVVTEKLYPLGGLTVNRIFGIEIYDKNKYFANALKSFITQNNFNKIIDLFSQYIKDKSKTDEVDQLKYNRAGRDVMNSIIRDFDDVDSSKSKVNPVHYFAHIITSKLKILNINFDDYAFQKELIEFFYKTKIGFPSNYNYLEYMTKKHGIENINKLETIEFIEFLKYLKEKFNVIFDDLFNKNIMMRKNGDLVICDVGTFEFNE